MKKILSLLVAVCTFSYFNAQTTITIGSGTSTNGSTESGPINLYYRSHHCQILYTVAELSAAGWNGPGNITQLGFNIFSTTSEALPNFSIKLKNTSSNDLSVYDGSGLNTVYSNASYLPTAGGFELLTLDNSFFWDGASNLLVDVCFDQVSAWSSTGQTYNYTYSSSGSQYEYIQDDNNPTCSVPTANANSTLKPQLQLTFTNVTPCAGITGPYTVSASTNSICLNTALNLNVSPIAAESGITYQWQSSSDGSTWTNFGSTSLSGALSIPQQSVSTYYQAIVTCTNSASSATAGATYVSQNPFYNCMCTPQTLYCSSDYLNNITFANINDNVTCGTNGFSDQSTVVPTASLTAGNSYTIDATIAYTSWTGYIGAWIDYNHNGLFDADEYSYLGSGGSSAVVNGTINIPFTSLGGLTKMRIRYDSDYNGIPSMDPCSGTYSGYGQNIDYLVDITAAPSCTGTPNAGTAISSVSTTCSNNSYTLNLSGNDAVSGIDYQWQSSTDGSTWTNLGSNQSTIPYSVNSQSTTTYYQCVLTCNSSSLSATSASVTVAQNSFLLCYCTPGSVYAGSDTLTHITFENTDMVPEAYLSSGGYLDYSSSVATVTLNANQTYTLLTGISTSSPSTGYLVSAWIDYNQNGYFETSELSTIGNGLGSDTITGNINVPFYAQGGNTKMRLRFETDYTTIYNPADPCTSQFGNGEVIDYMINIIPVPACSGSVTPGSAVSNYTAVCENTEIKLSLSGNGIASGVEYKWQSSTDGLSWTDLCSAQTTPENTVFTQTVTTYYQCLVTCVSSSLTTTSNSVTVLQKPSNQCYCIPPPDDCNGYEIDTVIFAALNHTSTCSGPDGYADYTTSVPSTTIQAGETYTMSVYVGNSSGQNISVWIDYNQNGVFDTYEYTYLGSNSGNDSIGNTIDIPVDATLGTTRMRIRNYAYSSLQDYEACNNPSAGFMLLTNTFKGSGETEDYLVTITAPNCSLVNFPPSAMSTATSTLICKSGNVTFDLNNSMPVATGITYQWKSSSDGINYSNAGGLADTSSYQTNVNQDIYYVCEVSCNTNSMFTSDSILVSVTHPSITISSSPSNTICIGNTVTLDASAADSYTWSTSSTTNSTIVTPTVSSTYTLITSTQNCNDTITYSVTVNPLPTVYAGANQTVCANTSVTLAGSGANTYTWTGSVTDGAAFTATVSDTYIVTGTDNNGCTNKDTVDVIVNPLPTISTGTNNITVCQSTTLTLSGAGASTYTWSGGITDGTTFTVTASNNYTVTGTDINGCSATSVVSINMIPSKDLLGTVTSTSGVVTGDVILYKYSPTLMKWDSIMYSPIISSTYSFAILDSADYVVKAVPTATNMQITYAPSAISWQNSTIISHGCTNNSTSNILIQEFTSIGTGNGSISGVIREGTGYGQRPGASHKPMAPGNPIPGVVVKGGKNPGAQIVKSTVTNNNGAYSFTNLPAGDYFILVDIPGLDTNGTYHIIVNENTNDSLNFVVDSEYVNPNQSITTVIHNIEIVNGEVTIYPNPAKNFFNIEYTLVKNAEVQIELYNIIGEHIKTIQNSNSQYKGMYSQHISSEGLKPGLYFIKMIINHKESMIKLIVSD